MFLLQVQYYSMYTTYTFQVQWRANLFFNEQIIVRNVVGYSMLLRRYLFPTLIILAYLTLVHDIIEACSGGGPRSRLDALLGPPRRCRAWPRQPSGC